MPRVRADNPLISRWVLKLKQVDDKKTLKARLIVQGFKDKQEVDNYAGTSTRWSQRLVLIICAQMRWALTSADVSEAFQRGLTSEQLAKLLGEVKRSCQLELPPGAAAPLRELPRMKDFNDLKEVLNMVKPGYGLKDAPCLCALALPRALKAMRMTSCKADPELHMLHEAGRLVLVLSTHVDDLKFGGTPEATAKILQRLEEQFDRLRISTYCFEHCGVMHTQGKNTFEIAVDQHHHLHQLRPMADDAWKRCAPDTLLDADAYSVFRSLLGGVAWMAQTRPDTCVYIPNLQRHVDKPRAIDAVNLNRVLRHLKRRPVNMAFKAVEAPWSLAVISDSAVQSQDQDSLALRSGIIALATKAPKDGKC